jgi:hypothetical protein
MLGPIVAGARSCPRCRRGLIAWWSSPRRTRAVENTEGRTAELEAARSEQSSRSADAVGGGQDQRALVLLSGDLSGSRCARESGRRPEASGKVADRP